jgi:hypothetical protein
MIKTKHGDLPPYQVILAIATVFCAELLKIVAIIFVLKFVGFI